MWWLWLVGPLAALGIYALTAQPDKRRLAAADRWAAGERLAKAKGVPAGLRAMFTEVGGGRAARLFELYPKLAYLGVFDADATAGSDHQTVVCKLDTAEKKLTFTVRPLPIVEGRRVPNTGILFSKHPAFSELFLVEAAPEQSADVKKWLTRPLRKALLEFPDLWVRVEGHAMAVTLYGPATEADFTDLLATADVLFAEYGAEGGPSLLLDDEDDEDEADEADDEDATDDEPAPKAATKTERARGARSEQHAKK